MTGPYDSVLGMRKDQAIKRLLTATPHKYEVASHDVRLCAVYVQADGIRPGAEDGKHCFPRIRVN